jgi:ribose transport system substrate-binding protein
MTSSLVACGTTPDSTEDVPTIYVVIKALGNQYWAVLQGGALDAGRDLGANVIITGIPDEVRIEDQNMRLQNAVGAKADAILLAVADSKAQAPEVDKAAASNIPIILVDTMVEADSYTAALLTDNKEAGKAAAAELIRILKEKGTPEDKVGTVAMQIGSAGSQTIILRMEGFQEYWAANAPANWQLLSNDIKINDGDISKAIGFGQDFLTAYPDLIGMFAPNNGSTVGFATALTEKERKDIAFVGFDFSAEMRGMIRSGDYAVSTMLQNQYFMGYNGVKTALEIINGTAPAEKKIDTGLMIVNSTNVDTEDVWFVATGGREAKWWE